MIRRLDRISSLINHRFLSSCQGGSRSVTSEARLAGAPSSSPNASSTRWPPTKRAMPRSFWRTKTGMPLCYINMPPIRLLHAPYIYMRLPRTLTFLGTQVKYHYYIWWSNLMTKDKLTTLMQSEAEEEEPKKKETAAKKKETAAKKKGPARKGTAKKGKGKGNNAE
jgi:hypothetical protein